MKRKKAFSLILMTGLCNSVLSQVTTYNFDPAKVNKELSAKMDSLYNEDQKYRLELTSMEKSGASKQKLDNARSIIKSKDHSNLILATKLIDKYGWLDAQKVGFQGTQALFLIIQHADLKTQKKYYPILLEAEKNGKIVSSNLAILEDRIAVREGREQTYGSQIYYDAEKKKGYVYPLADLKKLDELRKSRGLQPMNEYKKDWDVNEYESCLPYAKELLAKSKEANKI